VAPPSAPLTPDEIQRRVTENDTARSRRRATIARRVGELARAHAAIADELADLERQLGEVLANADDVVTIAELATFTGVPTADITRWRAGHKPRRTTRKKATPSLTSAQLSSPGPHGEDPSGASSSTQAAAPARDTIGS
jgi:hypothetical protein